MRLYVASLLEFGSIIMDAVLGGRCPRCRQRVFNRDAFAHDLDCD